MQYWRDQSIDCPIETSPCLINQNVWLKLKLINEKNIKFLRKNWYIDFTFLGEDVVVHVNVMLLSLFFQIPISFPVLLCYSLVDMRLNLGSIFVLTLIYLVSDRRELSLSKHKLENLYFFTCLIEYLGATRKFSGQERFLEVHLQHMKERPRMVKFWSFFSEIPLKHDFKW